MRSSQRAIWLGAGLAIAGLALAAGATLAQAFPSDPRLQAAAGSRGPVPACTAEAEQALPFQPLRPAALPANVSRGGCEIAGGNTSLPRWTEHYSTPDRGWMSITVTKAGASVDLTRAADRATVDIRGIPAEYGVVRTPAGEIAALYFDRGTAAVVINAKLTPILGREAVLAIARALEP